MPTDGIPSESMVSHSNTLPAAQFIRSNRSALVAHTEVATNHMPDIDALDDNAYCHQMTPDNISYLNISCETDLSYSVPLYGYASPFLLVTTVIANTLIVLVLSKRTMTSPTNLVLMG